MTAPLTPENATPLLWAHQLKREHRYLLQRLETLESTAQRDAASLASHDATTTNIAEKHKNTTSRSDGLESAAAIELLEARVSSLEQSSADAADKTDDATADAVHALQASTTALQAQLAALQSQVQTLHSSLDERFTTTQKEQTEQSDSMARLNRKVSLLDDEVSADAAAVKRAADEARDAQRAVAELSDCVWAVENGVSNLESGRRGDRERLGGLAGLVKALDAGVKEGGEKVDRVVRVAEVLIDRDEEVRGRVGELEARAAEFAGRLEKGGGALYEGLGHGRRSSGLGEGDTQLVPGEVHPSRLRHENQATGIPPTRQAHPDAREGPHSAILCEQPNHDTDLSISTPTRSSFQTTQPSQTTHQHRHQNENQKPQPHDPNPSPAPKRRRLKSQPRTIDAHPQPSDRNSIPQHPKQKQRAAEQTPTPTLTPHPTPEQKREAKQEEEEEQEANDKTPPHQPQSPQKQPNRAPPRAQKTKKRERSGVKGRGSASASAKTRVNGRRAAASVATKCVSSPRRTRSCTRAAAAAAAVVVGAAGDTADGQFTQAGGWEMGVATRAGQGLL